MDSDYIWTFLCMDSGYIKTLFMYRQWLYQEIAYIWIVVISRHCLCMDSGYIWTFLCMNSRYIKTLFMYEK